MQLGVLHWLLQAFLMYLIVLWLTSQQRYIHVYKYFTRPNYASVDGAPEAYSSRRLCVCVCVCV